jgi:hypothetical protein
MGRGMLCSWVQVSQRRGNTTPESYYLDEKGKYMTPYVWVSSGIFLETFSHVQVRQQRKNESMFWDVLRKVWTGVRR